ncbi:MAG: Ni/Fe hydrogenase subunit alpha [Deltaproteobacteria bacterium]|jgi:coenzyme F420-reducing hydrogenase alpha subunit|nr:Ni/Fe hydrogenase subunit alpha [Deltaproteobacteria bacterium]MBW2532769.1 Ni/Fe hydrogenase subunit alpha [Deltaproteobacteria bacterium]
MTTKTIEVNVHHLARVEGHGNIHVRIKDGAVEEARWEVVETPRFFEVMLKGKHYSSAGILTARICGICSIGHCLASVRATERALGVEVPERAAKLRLLAKHGETLQSHVLHLMFLAAPDYLGLPSAIPLAELKPEVFALTGRLKGVGNDLCDAVAGRTTHPVSILVGGMGAAPPAKKLDALADRLASCASDLAKVVDVFNSFDVPDFVWETEYVSLAADGSYPWIGGDLLSTDGVKKPEDDYLAMTNEYVTADNTSKWCKLSRKSMAVGALARFNNNFDALHPEAKKVAAALGLEPVCHNPYQFNAAQIVECAHVVHESLELIAELRDATGPLMADFEPRAGHGVGAVEVPRGILYHDYEYGDDGRVIKANCVIPTTQNHANIHHDIETLAALHAARGTDDAEIERLCSMLVRAYDPCISCSVH